MKKNIRFVVVGTQRSGTTLIQTTLNSHPDISCFGELFMMKVFKQRYYQGPGYYNWLSKRLDRWGLHFFIRKISALQYLQWFEEKNTRTVLGFKLMWNQTKRFPGSLDYIIDNNYKIIHVIRTNVLRSYVSRKVAESRGVYHSETDVVDTNVIIDTKKILKRLNIIKADNEYWKLMSQLLEYHCVEYESYVKNPELENQKMLEFLQVSSEYPVQSKLRKMTSNDLRKVIKNYDEVVKTLKDTDFEKMLDN